MNMLSEIRDILLNYKIEHPKEVKCKCIGGAMGHLQVQINALFEKKIEDAITYPQNYKFNKEQE